MPSWEKVGSDLIPHSTVSVMAGVYRVEMENLKRLHDDCKASTKRLASAFLDSESWRYGFQIAWSVSGHRHGDDSWEVIQDKFKRDAWASIVHRIGLKKIMSVKKREEFDKQMSSGELPEITEETIYGVLSTWATQAQDMVKEAAVEVFNWLRPSSRNSLSDLKTNCAWKVGRKAIMRGCEPGYGRSKFRIGHYSQAKYTAMDNVFHSMDGKGALSGTYGPLCDAVSSSESSISETDYFRVKCHKNGNVHIEFKRLDLVKQLNYLAAGVNEIGDDS